MLRIAVKTMGQLFSYDVFDTAVTRLVLKPDHLHWSVGTQLSAQCIVQVGEERWRTARRKAEDELRRRTPSREITLAEIYAELAVIVPLTQTQMLAAMEIEVAEEIKLARPIAVIKKKIEDDAEEGRQQCFISDTYLSTDHMKRLLLGCGYTNIPVHASSEYLKTKANGDLFAAVGARQSIPCRDIVHIGDNAVSDVTRARAAGCEASLFEGSQPTQREQILFSAGTSGFVSSAIAGAARAARLEYGGTCSEGIRTAASSVAGPLLTAYVLFVLQDVVKRGGRTIYWLARDGQILHRICERLIAYLKVDVKSRYLLGSRRAFFLAALPQDVGQALASAFALAKNEKVSGILISLGFDTAECASIIAESGVLPAQLAGSVSESALGKIEQSISSTPDRPAGLIERITAAKSATLQYFSQEGFTASDMISVADLGWHGNLQLRMQRILGEEIKVFGYYVRLYSTPGEIADYVQTWTSEGWPQPTLLEVFTLADHKSIYGFQLDSEKKAVSVPLVEEETDLVEWGVRHQHELIDLFVRNLLHAVDSSIYEVSKLASALKESGVAAFKHFIHFPTRAEGHAYGSILLAGDQNHRDVREIAPMVSNLAAVRMLRYDGVRRAGTNWFQGSLARSEDKLAPAALRTFYSAMGRFRALAR